MSSNNFSTPANEEPEIAFEESIPLDGPDPEGERMIEELGRGERLQQVPEQESEPPAAEPMPQQLPVS